MFVAGQSTFDAGVFGVLSMFVGIFTAIKVFNWVGTHVPRLDRLHARPSLYFFGFLFFLVFGGMTGIAVATASLDVHWHDTYFVVAHFHFIMVGAAVMAFLAGAPLLVPEDVRPHVLRGLGPGGGVADHPRLQRHLHAAVPARQLGMPRRYYHTRSEFQALNVASTAGATLLAFGFLIILIYLVIALRYGRRVRSQSLGQQGIRMDDRLAAAHAQLRQIPTITQMPHDYRTHEPPGVIRVA